MQTLRQDFSEAMRMGDEDDRGMTVLEAIGYDVDSLN